jgi:6-phosphofructokinase 1
MKKNLLVAQSGGPSSAINATLSGILEEAIKSGKIDKVYGGINGIYGILSRQLVELTGQITSNEDLRLLETTPGMALGSCRFQLPAPTADDKLYAQILKTFEDYNIGYFLYLGGANSMDTVKKLGSYFAEKGSDIRIIGVPKTVDNDMPCTDHTPGFGSAAKFIATSMLEIIRDSEAYPVSSVTIVEIMGKESGWLTASSILPRSIGNKAPHLVYLPEVPFSMGQFINDVQEMMKKERAVIIAVSEGYAAKAGCLNGIDSVKRNAADAEVTEE